MLQRIRPYEFEGFANLVYKEWTESAQWTAPEDAAGPCQILCCGGGGGGGGQCSYRNIYTYTKYGGGGGGGYTEIVQATIVPGQVYEIVCGAGGNTSVFDSNGNATTNATDGGTSSFGTLCSAAGGKHGGIPSNPSNWSGDIPAGGDGGAGGGGGIGMRVGSSETYKSSVGIGGNGSMFGAGGGDTKGVLPTHGPYGRGSGYQQPVFDTLPLIILPPAPFIPCNPFLPIISAQQISSAGGGGLCCPGFNGYNNCGGGGGGFMCQTADNYAQLFAQSGGGGYLSRKESVPSDNTYVQRYTRGAGGNYDAAGASGVVAIWYYTK